MPFNNLINFINLGHCSWSARTTGVRVDACRAEPIVADRASVAKSRPATAPTATSAVLVLRWAYALHDPDFFESRVAIAPGVGGPISPFAEATTILQVFHLWGGQIDLYSMVLVLWKTCTRRDPDLLESRVAIAPRVGGNTSLFAEAMGLSILQVFHLWGGLRLVLLRW